MADRPTSQQLDEALADGDVRALQVIHAAFTFGVLMFLGVIVVLHVMGVVQDPGGETRLIDMLSLIHVGLLVVGVVGGAVLYRIRFGGLRPAAAQVSPARQAIESLRGAIIIRLALMEGPALLGLVVCLLGVKGGLMDETPLYWLNASSALLFIAFAVITLPTRGRLLDALMEQ